MVNIIITYINENLIYIVFIRCPVVMSYDRFIISFRLNKNMHHVDYSIYSRITMLDVKPMELRLNVKPGMCALSEFFSITCYFN